MSEKVEHTEEKKPARTAEEVQSGREIKKGLKAIVRHMKPFKKSFIVLVVLGLVSSVANGFVPYVTGQFFDALVGLSQGEELSGALGIPVWMFFLGIWALTQFVATNNDWIMDRMRRKVGLGMHMNIYAGAFAHFLRLPMSYHKNAQISGEVHKIGQTGWRIESIIDTLINIAPQLLSILIGVTLAARINGTMALVLLAGVVLYCILLIRILLPIAAIDFKAHKQWNEAWSDSTAAVHQIESVKQAAAEDYETDKTKKGFLDKTFALWYKLGMNWSNVGFFQRFIVFLTQLTVFILSVRFIAEGVITVGELVAINGYSMMFFGPFVSLGYSWQVIQNGITAAAQAEDIFETSGEKYTPENAISIGKLKGEVVFDNVSFKYEEGQPMVLEGINLHVKSGQVVALVGESGVGKSTAISLISAYHFPTEGKVAIDGVSTDMLNLKELRKQIAVVPQEVALFNDTIMTNIRYGSFDALDAEVKSAAKQAHIHDFIDKLPEGYESLVGERGIKLSVGQKQRVSIARAILRDPAILILDEPTSALDAKTEKIVTEALEKLMKGRTTFIIAHRLSTVRKADNILVFDKGGIVEQGTHEDLVRKKDGVYRHLYEYQVGLH